MTSIGKLEVEPAKLQKELEAAQNAYNKRPNTWSGNESLGRVLHWIRDPAAKQYFQKAFEIRLPMVRENGSPGWELTIVGTS